MPDRVVHIVQYRFRCSIDWILRPYTAVWMDGCVCMCDSRAGVIELNNRMYRSMTIKFSSACTRASAASTMHTNVRLYILDLIRRHKHTHTHTQTCADVTSCFAKYIYARHLTGFGISRCAVPDRRGCLVRVVRVLSFCVVRNRRVVETEVIAVFDINIDTRPECAIRRWLSVYWSQRVLRPV